MKDFLTSIPSAASSPYALAAYAVSAIIFIVAGAKHRQLKLLISRIHRIPDAQRKEYVEVALDRKLPEQISAEQWLRLRTARYIFLTLIAIIISATTVGVIAISRPGPPETDSTSMLQRQNAFDLGFWFAAYSGFLSVDEGEFGGAKEWIVESADRANSTLRFFSIEITLKKPASYEESRSYFQYLTQNDYSKQIQLALHVKEGPQISNIFLFAQATTTYIRIFRGANKQQRLEVKGKILEDARSLGLDTSGLDAFFQDPQLHGQDPDVLLRKAHLIGE